MQFSLYLFSIKFHEPNFETETLRVELWLTEDAERFNIKLDKNRATKSCSTNRYGQEIRPNVPWGTMCCFANVNVGRKYSAVVQQVSCSQRAKGSRSLLTVANLPKIIYMPIRTSRQPFLAPPNINRPLSIWMFNRRN